MTGNELPRLAVICSVLDEEETIPLFHARLRQVFEGLKGRVQPALYFVDNGCTDTSAAVITGLHEEYGDVFLYRLSRNFGYQCAIEYGVSHAPGDLFVIIDVDCEDPPEMIPEFLDHHDEGYDIVYGERLDRPEGELLKFARKLFYRITRLIADEHFILDMAEFSLMTREVRDAVVAEENSFPFLRANVGRIGFRRKNVPYRRQERVAGETHYNLLGMVFFAVAGMLSSSTFPLRLVAYALGPWLLALLAVGVGGMGAAWQVPTLLVLGFGYCGIAAAAVAIYTARTYKNGLGRPNAVLRRDGSLLPPEPLV